MLVKYEDTEEYEELEVTIIARIISNCVMRRSIEGRTDGLNEIYANKDYRTIEVLVIYQ